MTQLRQKSVKNGTACPVCDAPDALQRPRYFAGQLLTEAELNSAQTYLIEKNRLQNRYLHGVGVVCGLEVVCHDCDGYVTIKPGYAISPCGDDILVPEPHDFNLIEAIKKYRKSNRVQKDCTSPQSRRKVNCDEDEDTWCVVIKYVEKEASPTTPILRQQSCTNGSRVKAASCEPTRIHESYRIEVMPGSASCDLKWSVKAADLLGPFYNCLQAFGKFVAQQILLGTITTEEFATVFSVAFREQVPPDFGYQQAIELNTICNRFWCFANALFTQNPLGLETQCAQINKLDIYGCQPPPPPRDEMPQDVYVQYYRETQKRFQGIINLMIAYVIDCLCSHFLPPCPPEETEDYLVLACVQVTDNQITRIGNFCCRRFAGSFPSRSHWFSLVPILPLFVDLFKYLCCDPEIIQTLLLGLNRIDPDGERREGVLRDDMAGAKAYTSRVRKVSSDFSLANLLNRFHLQAPTAESVNLEAVKEMPTAEAEAILAEREINVVRREVASEKELSNREILTAPVFAKPGEQLIAYYTPDNKVVGFKRYDVVQELEEKKSEISGLRAELDELKVNLARLQKD